LGKRSLAECEKSKRDAKRLKGGLFHILESRLLSNYLTVDQQNLIFKKQKEIKQNKEK
jgi:hypothetical protein